MRVLYAGSLLLLLAYVGSRFVLEVVLGRTGMKYLLVLAIVLAVIWFWRNNRRGDDAREPVRHRAKASTASTAQPQDMVQCPVCWLHLPRTDALPGPDGRLYCCAEHRLRAGG